MKQNANKLKMHFLEQYLAHRKNVLLILLLLLLLIIIINIIIIIADNNLNDRWFLKASIQYAVSTFYHQELTYLFSIV